MTTVFAFLEDVKRDEFRRAADVTYHGSVWGIRAALKRMKRDLGTIVQVGSAMAYRGIPLRSPHCRDKFDRRSMPVPPVYQPEVAAEAIHWAAHHRRREVYVGVPTVYTIWGNKLAPWLAERYLAKTAVSGQLSDAPKRPDRAALTRER